VRPPLPAAGESAATTTAWVWVVAGKEWSEEGAVQEMGETLERGWFFFFNP
jgi:hypothetical protein